MNRDRVKGGRYGIVYYVRHEGWTLHENEKRSKFEEAPWRARASPV